jgi:hypothetical protein
VMVADAPGDGGLPAGSSVQPAIPRTATVSRAAIGRAGLTGRSMIRDGRPAAARRGFLA